MMIQGEKEEGARIDSSDGANECVNGGTVQTMEMLPSGVALAALAHASPSHDVEAQELHVSLSVEYGPPGASWSPTARPPAAACSEGNILNVLQCMVEDASKYFLLLDEASTCQGGYGDSGNTKTRIRLFWSAKEASVEVRGVSKNSSNHSPLLACKQLGGGIRHTSVSWQWGEEHGGNTRFALEHDS